MPATRWWCAAVAILLLAGSVRSLADGLSFAYEGDVLPYDPPHPFPDSVPCPPPCEERIDNGHFQILYPIAAHSTGYGRYLINPGEPIPPNLWVEWSFRSNHSLGPFFYGCDGGFGVTFRSIGDLTNMYGDAAISESGDSIIYPLDMDVFHTYRFESLDGEHFRTSVDGELLFAGYDPGPHVYAGIGMHYFGGCNGDWIPDNLNEWDFVRYGAITFGERIVESDPPTGFIDPGSPQNLALDRITVTYDSPAYAYIDDIAVGVTCDAGPECAPAPQIIATKRLDNGPPDVLEIVLDRPLAPGERTTFTFTEVYPSDPDHPTINAVAYTFQRGDLNADGQWNLLDFASLQNCFFNLATTNTCAAFDYDVSIFVDAEDYAAFALDFVDHGP